MLYYLSFVYHSCDLLSFCEENFEVLQDPHVPCYIFLRFYALNQNFISGSLRPHKIDILGTIMFFSSFIDILISANYMAGYIRSSGFFDVLFCTSTMTLSCALQQLLFQQTNFLFLY